MRASSQTFVVLVLDEVTRPIRRRLHLKSLQMTDHSVKSEIPLSELFLCSAFAACFAELCTIPLDTAKIRLQLQRTTAAVSEAVDLPKYKGLFRTVFIIARDEGLTSLWNGIAAGLRRQIIYGGLRIGLYEPVQKLLVGSDAVGAAPLYHKILAALFTGSSLRILTAFPEAKIGKIGAGAVAISVANPTDLVKVRLQAEGKCSPGMPRRYAGALDAYVTIVRQEGVAALWTGLGPNVARNAVINAAELASYDKAKQMIIQILGFADNAFCHLLAGLAAGFFAVCVGSPMDVLKSRMMGDFAYKSTLDCFFKTLNNEGVSAFYKGFLPNFCRLGTWNVIMFFTLEQAKKLFIEAYDD